MYTSLLFLLYFFFFSPTSRQINESINFAFTFFVNCSVCYFWWTLQSDAKYDDLKKKKIIKNVFFVLLYYSYIYFLFYYSPETFLFKMLYGNANDFQVYRTDTIVSQKSDRSVIYDHSFFFFPNRIFRKFYCSTSRRTIKFCACTTFCHTLISARSWTRSFVTGLRSTET